MTTITGILRWSSEWHSVLLACGHTRRLRKAELLGEQLFIGKRVACEDCAREGGE